jgi:hypothetical protein
LLGGLFLSVGPGHEKRARLQAEADAQAALYDVDRNGKAIVKVTEKATLTIGKLNEQLKKEKEYLQNINIEDRKGIENSLIKIKGLEDRIKALTTLADKRAIIAAPSEGGFGHLKIPSFGGAAGGLAGAPITQLDIKTIETLTNGLLSTNDAVNILANSFEELFSKTGKGFQGMIDNMIAALNRLLSEMIAKAVLWSILNIITGGQAGTFKAFMGLGAAATGGGGGGSLPAAGGAPIGKAAMDINVIGSISGKDIALSLRRNL